MFESIKSVESERGKVIRILLGSHDIGGDDDHNLYKA